jgi:hypothetical protein
MTRPAGNGNGRRSTSTATIDPAELHTLAAPARLARALAITGNDVPAAQRLLKTAGYPVSIRGGDHDEPEDGDGLYAAHPVNVSAAGFSYSAAGSPGHEACCATRPRGLYQGTRHAGNLPHVHARVMTREGRTSTPSYVMSARPDGPRTVIAWEDVDSGRWAMRLNMARSADRRIRDAIETVIYALAHEPDVDERPAALAPSSRTKDGRIPVPAWEVLPPGYGDTPGGPEADRLAARHVQADIAARSPQIALLWAASVVAPYAAALRVQSCLWEPSGPARRGKTTTVQLAASVWGNPLLAPDPGIVMSWDATAKGPGRLLGMLGILPAFIDETGTAEFDRSGWARLIYSLTQGASRLMAETHGPGMRRTPGWQGFLIVSGNGTITDRITAGKYAGVPARVITLDGPFTGSAEESRQLRAAVEDDYGYLGPAVLAAVTVEQMRAWHAAALAAIGAPDGGTLGTTAEQLAAAVAGAMAIDLVLGTGNQVAAAAARAARDYLGAASEPESDRDRAVRTLREWLSSNRPAWPDRAGYEAHGQAGDEPGGSGGSRIPRHGYLAQLDGLRDDAWLYVYPAAWERLADETGITEKTVLRELHSAGDLHVPESKRRRGEWTAPGPRWAGMPAVYKIRLAALDTAPADDDGQDDEPADVGPGPGPAREIPADVDSRARDDADPWAAERDAMAAYHQSELPAPAAAEYVRTDPAEYGTTSEQSPAPASPGPSTRAAWLATARTRQAFHTDGQWEAFEKRAAQLDTADVGEHPERLRILAALEGRQDNRDGQRGRIIPGPFAPRRAKRAPWFQPWRDGIPPAVDTALIVSAWGWDRDYSGPAVVLDRSGAWVAGLASATFAHGALTQTGPWDGTGAVRPGYYLVSVYPWTEPGMPAPLGMASPDTRVWVPAPTMGLLRELADAGRWPDPGAADSWTGEPCRLTEWAGLTRELRRYAIEVHGRDSDAYGAVKRAFGQAMSLLKGGWAEDTAAPRKVWKCLAQRLDWPDHAETQAAVTMWRAADECLRLAGPELGPVAVGRNIDELVIPAAALDTVTGSILPGKNRPPVRLDPAGIELGTFKVKGREDW